MPGYRNMSNSTLIKYQGFDESDADANEDHETIFLLVDSVMVFQDFYSPKIPSNAMTQKTAK